MASLTCSSSSSFLTKLPLHSSTPLKRTRRRSNHDFLRMVTRSCLDDNSALLRAAQYTILGNLSSRGLTGHIAVYISKLTELESLDLSNNSLIGAITVFLVENLPSLRVLNLQNNNLTGLIPNALLPKSSEGVLSL
ncbi:hypothetical protein HN51_047020, partial [Arachis hypogaea]